MFIIIGNFFNTVIVIFPSSLTHMVEQTISDDTRVSLAFNTFLKGNIGNNFELTELINN